MNTKEVTALLQTEKIITTPEQVAQLARNGAFHNSSKDENGRWQIPQESVTAYLQMQRNKKHRKRITTATIAFLITVLGLISISKDGLDLIASYILPLFEKTTATVQTLCSEGEATCPIIIIATFEGNDSILYQNRLFESIEEKIKQTGNEVIVKKLEISISSSDESALIAKEYGAEVVIWGWQDEEGVRIYLLDTNYQATEMTKGYQWGYDYIHYPDQLHEIKIGVVPEETAFISLYSIGTACYFNENYNCAQIALSAAITSSSNVESLSNNANSFINLLPSAYLYSGLAKMKQNAFDEALTDFDKSTELDMSLGAYGYRGLGYYDLGNTTKALLDADEAVKMAPQNFYAHYIRAFLYSRANSDKTIALQEYTTLISWKDIDCRLKAMAYNGRGNLFIMDLAFEKALEDFNQALLCASNKPKAVILTNKGIALNGLKRHTDAIIALDEAISISNNFSAPYYGRGLTNLALGNLDAGISDLRHYLELSPKAIDREEIETRISVARDYGAEVAANSMIYSTLENTRIVAPAPGKVTRVVTDYKAKDVTLFEIEIAIIGLDYKIKTQIIAAATPVVNENDRVLSGQIIGVIQKMLPNLKDRSMIFVLMENERYVWSNDQWTIGGYPPFYYIPFGVFPDSN